MRLSRQHYIVKSLLTDSKLLQAATVYAKRPVSFGPDAEPLMADRCKPPKNADFTQHHCLLYKSVFTS
jgi:hypothetical protein